MLSESPRKSWRPRVCILIFVGSRYNLFGCRLGLYGWGLCLSSALNGQDNWYHGCQFGRMSAKLQIFGRFGSPLAEWKSSWQFGRIFGRIFFRIFPLYLYHFWRIIIDFLKILSKNVGAKINCLTNLMSFREAKGGLVVFGSFCCHFGRFWLLIWQDAR